MQQVTTIKDCRALVQARRACGQKIGFVPTMGALHDGHLSLLRQAKADGHETVASIFVNPAQFGPNEDFALYPRRAAEDAALLEQSGAGLLFLPEVQEIYPHGFATDVRVKNLGDYLCGPFRPGHFEGVATVVCKLLNIVQPDTAYFGEKDWQQLQVIKGLVRDLDMPVHIVGVPTLREADGLAMSSRNQYLDAVDRAKAPLLYITLCDLATKLCKGGDIAALLKTARRGIEENGFQVDYLEYADGETLVPLRAHLKPARLFVAARLGRTRLIDNIPVA